MGILVAAITDYLGLVFSLWLALYLLARGYANRLVLRAALALLAVSAYYLAAFARSTGALHTAGFFPAASIVIALMSLHNLSHYLLPPAQQAAYTWLRRGVNAGGLASLGILLAAPPPDLSHPQWLSPFPLDSLAVIAGAFQALTSFAILFNLWQVRRRRAFLLNRSFYAALAFGAAAVLYGVVGALFDLRLPRPPATIMLLGGLVLLGYSAARYQALVIRRTLPNDFLLTTAFAFSLAALYILAAHPFGATVFQSGLAGVLALASHTAYDVFRTQLQRRQERRARSLRGELRTTLRPSALPPDTLRRTLAILCHSLQASSGFIARRRGDEYTLAAALHTPLTELPAQLAAQFNFAVRGHLQEVHGLCQDCHAQGVG
jgi:xanthosine utilization system XapX-like protein